MTTPPNTRGAYQRGYIKGREDERQQAEATISKLKEALNKALTENVALREAAKSFR